MFEILMFLFENYMESHSGAMDDHSNIVSELEQAGFSRHAIGKALDWLNGLHKIQETVDVDCMKTSTALRSYTNEESDHLKVDGKGFLLYLEQLSILDPMTREIVIDRLMVLDKAEVDLARIKWVVLIALFNQPDKKSALSLLQDLILPGPLDLVH